VIDRQLRHYMHLADLAQAGQANGLELLALNLLHAGLIIGRLRWLKVTS
jgi:hypothetical protein